MRSKKLTQKMLEEIARQQRELARVNQSCTIPGHVLVYEKDESGTFYGVCHTCDKEFK